jgi:hypothetical protein
MQLYYYYSGSTCLARRLSYLNQLLRQLRHRVGQLESALLLPLRTALCLLCITLLLLQQLLLLLMQPPLTVLAAFFLDKMAARAATAATAIAHH